MKCETQMLIKNAKISKSTTSQTVGGKYAFHCKHTRQLPFKALLRPVLM